MKKILPFVVAGLISGLTLQGQSIDFSNFTFDPNLTDRYYRGLNGSYTAATPGANMVWDYSNVIQNGMDSVQYYDAKDSINGYPPVHNYYVDNLFSPSGGIISAYAFFSLNSAGLYTSAYWIDRYTESLTAISGGPNDVLEVPGQRFVFSDSLLALKFPVDAQSAWTSENNRLVNFNLSVAGFNLNATPGQFKNTDQQTRTVVGSGRIIIPDENGNPLPSVEVLMMEVSNTAIDSVYLGGAPAPATLMSAFGLSQGTTFTSRFVLFYPLNGAGFPVVGYNLDANNNATGFTYRPAVARSASIGLAEKNLAQFAVFPNPSKAENGFELSWNKETKAAAWEILSLNGQRLRVGHLNEVNKSQFIQANLEAGVYLLHLINERGQTLGFQKLQLN